MSETTPSHHLLTLQMVYPSDIRTLDLASFSLILYLLQVLSIDGQERTVRHDEVAEFVKKRFDGAKHAARIHMLYHRGSVIGVWNEQSKSLHLSQSLVLYTFSDPQD